MTEQIKTIFMTRAKWETWTAALLSGEYKQSRDQLYSPHTGGYCCLGVLEKALSDSVEPDCVPSQNWLTHNDVRFTNGRGDVSDVPSVFVEHNGALEYYLVSELNDNDWSFEQLVEVMRPHVQFTDENN